MADTTLDVNLNTDAAQQGLKDLDREAAKSGKSVEQSLGEVEDSAGKLGKGFDLLKGVAIAAFGVMAGAAVIGKIGDFVGAASEAEQATQGVASALARMGELSADSVSGVSDFADELSALTGIEDDAILKGFSLASSFGLTREQAEKTVKAATELSAATGKDFSSSVEVLAKSFDGTAGALNNVNPAMRNLSEEALKAGAGVDLIMKTMGGAAAAQLQTFGGSVTSAKNAFGNLEEALGNLIIKNPVVIKTIQKVGEVIGKLTESVDGNADGFRSFISGTIVGAIDVMGRLLPVLKAPIAVLDGVGRIAVTAAGGVLQLLRVFTGFETVDKVVKSVAGAVLDLATAVADILQVVVQVPGPLLEKLGVDFDPSSMIDGLEGIKRTLADANEVVNTGDLNKQLDVMTEAVLAFGEKGSTAFGMISEAIDAAAAGTRDFAKELDGLPDTTPAPGAGLKNLPPGGLPQKEQAKTEGAFGGIGSIDLGIGKALQTAAAEAGTMFAQNVLGGEAGAKKLVGQLGGGLATLLGASGPLAAGIGSAIEVLGSDPESFGKLIDGFVQGVPRIIDNIVENIPTLVVAIAENSGEIITALVAASPRIVIALAAAMPEVAMALLQEITGGFDFQAQKLDGAFNSAADNITEAGEVVGAFFADIPEQLSEAFGQFLEFDKELKAMVGGAVTDFVNSFGNQFAESVGGAAMAFYNGIVEAVNTFIDGITPGGGGGGGFFSGGTDGDSSTWYADGGTVPAGYPNDSHKARLSSGEEVVNMQTANQLRDFLNGGQQAQLMALARIASLLEARQDIQATLSLDGAELARAQVDLSRRNARTA